MGAFAIAALVGVAIGVMSGLLGIGGGSIMVPVFRLAFGLSAVGSTATSLFTIIPTSISGAVSHIRGKTCVPKLGLALGVGGACTSPIGVMLAQMAPGWAVMLGAALVIAYSASTMLRKAMAMGNRAPAPADKRAQVARSTGDAEPLTGKRLLRAVLIGAVTGVASGFVGLGGGFLMVPLMVALMNMPMKTASGTSLIAIIILVLPATIMQCSIGNVDYVVGIATACGSIPGAVLGARLVNRVPERALRFLFAAFLGLAAVLLVVKETGLLG